MLPTPGRAAVAWRTVAARVLCRCRARPVWVAAGRAPVA